VMMVVMMVKTMMVIVVSGDDVDNGSGDWMMNVQKRMIKALPAFPSFSLFSFSNQPRMEFDPS
jgi:hypothetical protein